MAALGQVERLAARGDADDVEAVVGQVPFEEDAGLRLGLGEDQGGGHGAKLASVRAPEQMSFLADLRRTSSAVSAVRGRSGSCSPRPWPARPEAERRLAGSPGRR